MTHEVDIVARERREEREAVRKEGGRAVGREYKYDII